MKQISIITDDIVLFKLLEPFFMKKSPNCLIINYSSFTEIKKKLEEERFDLFIIDGIMLGRSSFDIVNYLRLEKQIVAPICFYSEVNLDYFKLKAHESGINYYFKSPFDPDKITDEIVSKFLTN